MINFQYSRPASGQAAIDQSINDNVAAFIAGGTNLVDLMKRGVVSPQKLIDLNALSLRSIEQKNNSMRIGALATNAAVASNEIVQSEYPLLSMAINAGASPQLRNMATTGGNIMQRTRCTYFYDGAMPCNKREPGSGCGALHGYNRMHAILGASDQCIAVHSSDMCVALAALDATVIVQNKKGERKIPLLQFHRLPGNTPQKDTNLEKGELITAVELPPSLFRDHVHYLKIRDRSSYAFALVSVAAALQFDGEKIREARLALGGVAHKPWRSLEAEKYLTGKQATTAVFNAAAKIALNGARGYGHNNFKLKLAPATIVEALSVAAKP